MYASQVVGAPVGEAIRAAVPEWLLPVVLAVTFLGNVGFLLGLFALDYWFVDRERGAHAIAIAVAGMAVVVGLKAIFAEPRPPAAVNVIPIDGYSFPSGHATVATVAYGVLAADLRAGTRRQRFAVAGVVVALVALSRVALGVHFVRDVVAGVVVGSAFLVGALALTGRSPDAAFRLAAATGVAAGVVAWGTHDGFGVLGASLGALLAWETLAEAAPVESRRRAVGLLGVALPALVAAGYVAAEGFVSPPAVFVLDAGLLAGVLAAPRAVARVL